jgi:hypothetical protein
MSTYLKSAAMSLLSKTLQAFLTKYLSDVDVEGVTLPSYDGSGWGVRLANVKLREGVQLMKMMPGRVVKKRKVRRRRRRRRRRKLKPEDTKGKLISSSRLKTSKEKYLSDGFRSENKYAKEGTESRTHTHEIQDAASDYIPKKNSFLTEENWNDKNIAKSPRRARTNSAFSTADFEIAVTTSTDYYTDEDIEHDSSDEARPSTPVQTSRMFSCFYNRNSRKGGLDGNSLHQGQQEQQFNGDAEATAFGEPLLGQSSGKTSIPTPNDIVDTEKTNSVTDNAEDNLDEDGYIYEYYEEEEDCEEEQELPLQLCLGENGRIGIVDVRLIGKELHIMVEDAVVTIEAMPILTKDDDIEKEGMEDSPDEISGWDNRDNGVAKEPGKDNKKDDNRYMDSATAETEQSTTTPKPEPKRGTVGDRVLADNGLARLISAIPHLLLRDICIRLIVRDEPMTPTTDENGGNPTSSTSSHSSNSDTDSNNIDGYSKPKPSSKDTMVEVGIGFLSVTSGEDILSRFQQEHTTAESDLQNSNNENGTLNSSKRSAASLTDSIVTKPPSLLKIPSNFVDANGEHMNEYLIRHIRTGRGPFAGISVQLFVPNSGLSQIVTKSTESSGDVWARQHWISSTKNHLLRCSGLDIQARIHMGTKRVDAAYSWFYGEYIDEDEDSSDFDSMILFGGMDTIAPGLHLPLPSPPMKPVPPLEPYMSRGDTPRKSNVERTVQDKLGAGRPEIESLHQPVSSIHPGVDLYHIDANGIQSVKVPSSFHRVSRGMVLKSCKDCMQLPSEVSDLCWEVPPNSNIKKDSSLDSSIPMPGLALQICIRDPLEINVDRNNIESIGLIKSLFTKPSSPKPMNDSNPKEESKMNNITPEIITAASIAEDATQTTTASTGFFSGLLYGKPEETIHEEDVPEDSFESYMQPESISVMGIYLAETVIRIHVMREDEEDRNLSFCYWQIDTKCLTLDRQTLATPEKTFSDLKLDIGRLAWDEYRGTSKKNLVSLGGLQLNGNRQRSNSSTSLSSMVDDHAQSKAPWPSTACALLDIPPPFESLAYKSREGHGLQLRFISVPSSTRLVLNQVSRSIIYARLGLTTVDSEWAIKNEISVTISEIMRNLTGRKKASPPTTEDKAKSGDQKKENDDSIESKKEDKENESPVPMSLMAYTVQVDSGNILLPPLVQVKMPMTRLSGERSSLAGFSIESELGKVDFAYGSKEPKTQKGSPILPHIAGLPENVRMHILFCLKDLSPLEMALNVKKEKNSFRRIKAVDKAILKTAKKITRRISKATGKKKTSSHLSSLSSRVSLLDSANRRQRILTEIMKLDDGELTNLWSVHQRYEKKLAKKLREEHGE